MMPLTMDGYVRKDNNPDCQAWIDAKAKSKTIDEQVWCLGCEDFGLCFTEEDEWHH